jgi:hypothetical protein
MRRALPFVALCLCACGGHVPLHAGFVPRSELQYDFDASRYADDAAVALYAEDGIFLSFHGKDDSFTQRRTHRVFAIQSEKAFDLAEVRIALHGNSQLVALRARHLKPDGTIVEIQPNEVIADEFSGDPAKGIAGRVFRFGDVQRGSVLEYVYVVEYPFLEVDDESGPIGEYPVRQYEAWIEASRPMIVEGRFYNVPARAQSVDGQDPDFRRIEISASNLPGSPKHEDFAPDWTFTQPRWAYRLKHWNFGGYVFPALETWNDVIGRWARHAWNLGNESLFDDFNEQVDVSECGGNLRCQVRTVRDLVDSQLEYSGVGSMREARKAAEVWRSREATAFERALIMRLLLERAGVDASLATYVARFTGQTDTDFPQTDRFNRVLVMVHSNDLLTWVDPTCRACKVGEVSDEARGVDALAFRMIVGQRGEPAVSSEWHHVMADGLAPPIRRAVHEATVWPSGDVTLDTRMERSGRFAFDRCAELRSWTEAHQQGRAHRDAMKLSATARLTDLKPPACDAEHATSSEGRSVFLPGHAVIEANRLYVPLTLLDPDYATTFDEPKRAQPIVFANGNARIEQKLHLTVPKPWRLDKPLAESARAEGFNATLEVVPAEDGADVRLTVDHEVGMHEASKYEAYHRVGEFLRRARLRLVEFKQ